MTITYRPPRNLLAFPLGGNADLRQELADTIGLMPELASHADLEEWTETALNTLALIRTGYDLKVILDRKTTLEFPGHECPDFDMGDLPTIGGKPVPFRMDASLYHETAAFHKHAGRKIILADTVTEHDYPEDERIGEPRQMAMSGGGRLMNEALAEFAGQKCFVKFARPAKNLWNKVFDVPEDATPKTCADMFREEYEYSMIPMFGHYDNVVLQEYAPMSYETRLFVVDGKVVSGAAAIESDTPLNRPDEFKDHVLPPLFSEKRSGGVIMRDDAFAAALLDKADEIIADISEEMPQLVAYTLDLARGPKGDVIMVEMNEIERSGLYANDPDRIMPAYVQAAIDHVLRHAGPEIEDNDEDFPMSM